jgi:hypothetical protein
MAPLGTIMTPRVLAAVLAGIGLLVLIAAAVSFVGSEGFAYDFQAYDLAARRIAAGQPLYPPGTADAYNSGRFEGLYLYPPPLAIALAPLTMLAPDEAALVFFVVRIALLAVGCAMLPARLEARLATFGIACLSFPVWYDLNLGNMSVLIFVLSAGLWRWQGSPLGGVMAAAAIAIRPTYAVVLLGWLARGALHPIGWTVLVGLVIAVLTVPIVAVDGWLDYVTILRGLESISTGPHNVSLTTTALAAGLDARLSQGALVVGFLIALAAIVYAARRRDSDVAIVVAISASLVLTPFVHSHYLTVLLIPAALLADRGWWAGLALPLLGWLPEAVLPIAAVIAMLLPLAAPPRVRAAPTVAEATT